MTARAFASTAGFSDSDPPALKVSVKSAAPSAILIEVRGELDLFTGRLLRQELEPYNDPSRSRSQTRRIIYLLAELEFIDVGGLHALLGAIDEHGPETITIREPSSCTRRLLELVGLDSMIEERAKR